MLFENAVGNYYLDISLVLQTREERRENRAIKSQACVHMDGATRHSCFDYWNLIVSWIKAFIDFCHYHV